MSEGMMLALIASLSAGACCTALLLLALGFARVRVRLGRAQRASGAGSLVRRLLRNGVPPLEGLAKRAIAFGPLGDGCSACARALGVKGYETSALAVGSLAVALCVAWAVAGVLLGVAVGGVLAFAAGWYAACSAATHMLSQRREAATDALPDALRTMGSCFGAGFTLPQTFHELEKTTPEPLNEVFSRARMELSAGVSVTEALGDMRNHEGVPSELSFLAVALRVQHQAGGSLQHVLDAARESLESEIEIRRSLRVHTAQARLSARVVVGVTLGLLAALSLLSKDFLAPFFSSTLGFAMLFVAVAMQVAGVFAVRRILAVEVS